MGLRSTLDRGKLLIPAGVRECFTRWGNYIGRRGAVLLLSSMFICHQGWLMVVGEPTMSALMSLTYAVALLPLHIWGVLFCAAGALGVLGALIQKMEPVAFSANSGLMITWSMIYLLAAMTMGSASAGAAIGNAALFAGVAALMMVVSGWAETPREPSKSD